MLGIDKTQSRFDYIDALRGWAILAVILAHAASMTRIQGSLRSFADDGFMGVHLFFVISAFTIFHMLSKHAQQESRPIRNFFIRRFFRIVPVYWFGILFYFLIWGALPLEKWWHYLMHMTLTNVLHPETQSSAVPGGWSISVEMLFYASVPLWFKWIRDLSRAWAFMLVCVFILPLITLVIRKYASPLLSGIDPYWISVYWERFPLNSIGSFSFGILLYFLLKDDDVREFIRWQAVGIGSVLLICSALLILGILPVVFPVRAHFYCFLFMLLALVLSANPFKAFVNPATIFVGRISYSLYIFHFAIMTWLYSFIPDHFPQLTAHSYLYFLVFMLAAVLLAIPAAWCCYQVIERSSIYLSSRWILRLEQKK